MARGSSVDHKNSKAKVAERVAFDPFLPQQDLINEFIRNSINPDTDAGQTYYLGTITGIINPEDTLIDSRDIFYSHSDNYERVTVAKSDKPKGWKFMKEYVHTDGTVYHKGVEQPSLKGTLPVTVIDAKPEKKKLTKQEKEDARQALGKEIEALKAKLFHETRKGKKSELTRALSKANRQLKKLL